MILKIIAAVVIVSICIYLIYKNSILEDKVDKLRLDIKFKDAHIKQQQEKIENILLEVKDLENELTVVYGKARVHPEEKRSEILMLRAK
jgi:peptidoglycan hydrolase CwlO-like protein